MHKVIEDDNVIHSIAYLIVIDDRDCVNAVGFDDTRKGELEVRNSLLYSKMLFACWPECDVLSFSCLCGNCILLARGAEYSVSSKSDDITTERRSGVGA